MKKMLCLLIFFVAVSFGWSDTIYLKNGNKIIGEVVKRDKNVVVVKMPFGKISLPSRQIKKIVKESPTRTIITQSSRLLSLGAHHQAVEYLKQALNKFPNDANIKKALANTYLVIGKKYIKENPQKASEFLFKAKKYDGNLNIRSYEKSIEKRQKHAIKIKLEADVFLQSENYQKALEKYNQAVAMNPDLQQTVAKHSAHCASELGNQKFRSRDYSEAVDFYEFALQQEPEVYPYIEEPWLYSKAQVIVKEYFEKQKWGMAANILDDMLKLKPDYPVALYMMGFALQEQRDYANAYYYYQRATKENISWNGNTELLQLAKAKAKKIAYENILNGSFSGPKQYKSNGKWHKKVSPHFVIYAQNMELANEVEKTLEHHWSLIHTKLAPSGWQQKWNLSCEVYVYPTRKDYVENTGLPEWSDGVSSMVYKEGTLYQHKILLYANAPLLFSNIIPHELTHIMYPWFLGYDTLLPLWLNEGIAMTSEAKFRIGARKYILTQALKRGENFPLQNLLSMKQYPPSENAASIFYAQSFSIVDYLIKEKGGTQKLIEFSESIASKNVSIALQNVYSIKNILELERLWLKYVTK